MVIDPMTTALVVVIGATATHNESANLLYLGKSHEPAPTACIDTKPIIHSLKWEAIWIRWNANRAVLLSPCEVLIERKATHKERRG
jgi:hypothetical protein